jgi:LysM repeat protein
MNARRFLLFLLLNAVVAVSATFAALWFWDRFVRGGQAPVAPAAPTATAASPTLIGALPAITPFPTLPTQPPALPQTHVVRAGETLGRIAALYGVTIEDLVRANNLSNPNALDVGQTLVIPIGGFEPTATPAPAIATVPPIPTATRDPNQAAPQLTIREIRTPGVLQTETVVIANSGGPVEMSGWTLRDEGGRSYTFPALTLFAGGSVSVRTTSGQNSASELFWGQTQAAWASGRQALLTDPGGVIVARFTVP